jgi:hypothetical protein
VLLHATALGRPVYERLGFVAETAYLTLAGPTRAPAAAGPRCGPGGQADLEAVLALDLAATGEDRRRLLGALWPAGGLVAGDGRPLGYHLPRPGARAGRRGRRPRAGLALLDAVRAGARRRGRHLGAGGQPGRPSVPGGGRVLRALPHGPDAPRPRVAWDPAALFGAHNLFWG